MTHVPIREFRACDRQSLRKISCQTAFLGEPFDNFFTDEEVLADALTLYFTDYEPGSCFVAVENNNVVGYVIGSKNVKKMDNIFIKNILPALFIKSCKKGVFFRSKNQKFILNIITCFIKGQFIHPGFSTKYPATLHINVTSGYRNRDIGSQLIDHYFNYLRMQGVTGLHLGTMSERAKQFFIKFGFTVLHKKERGYLHYILKRNFTHYILGKQL